MLHYTNIELITSLLLHKHVSLNETNKLYTLFIALI